MSTTPCAGAALSRNVLLIESRVSVAANSWVLLPAFVPDPVALKVCPAGGLA
ncbi:hypothetical protein ACFFYR_31100 [Paraburkholderia dipogonis]